jgi:hypothetical protein
MTEKAAAFATFAPSPALRASLAESKRGAIAEMRAALPEAALSPETRAAIAEMRAARKEVPMEFKRPVASPIGDKPADQASISIDMTKYSDAPAEKPEQTASREAVTENAAAESADDEMTKGEIISHLPAPLDEPSLRRPDFRQGEALILADGRAWTLPKPHIVWRPARGDDGKLTFVIRPQFARHGDPFSACDREYQALHDRLVEGDAGDRVAALLNLAAFLLRLNYDVSDDQLARLLAFSPDDEANVVMWSALLSVATGREREKEADAPAK